MPDVQLSGHELLVLRGLMGAEPVPGQPLASVSILERIDALVPCDVLGSGYVDMTGLVTSSIESHASWDGRRTVVADLDMHEQHDGPFYLGVMHWRLHPLQAEACGVALSPHGDELAVGFRNGVDHVVQYWFARESGRFTRRELAILNLLGPVLQRLARERPTPRLPRTLTISERRVLNDVAAGLSNAEIAEGTCISIGTVRKHLENSYRKLGVNSRLAAIARMKGCDEPGLALQERIDRYA
jgi:DNA-binding CsgD family transcriptional regulator